MEIYGIPVAQYILAWIVAICTYSFCIKETPLYRWVEHTYVATSGGYGFVLAIIAFQRVAITPIVKGKYILVIPVILGLLAYTRFKKDISWMVRLPFAFTIGGILGVALSAAISTQLLPAIQATTIDLTSPMTIFNSLITLGTVVVILVFFIFSQEPKILTVPMKYIRTAATYLMMIAFGATFGNQALSVLARTIGAILYLFGLA